MNLQKWKSSFNNVNKLFQDDQMKGSKVKVLSLDWNAMMDKMAIPTEKFHKMMMRLFLQKLWNKEKDWMIQWIKRILENGDKLWKRQRNYQQLKYQDELVGKTVN